ncbi:uncharacterized protein LOC132067074 [Lycium ferocissimum]|uniref:uncharacterized protein LOC132067074 n=1 Tax=Lycium ferocissimum TaxID=112874 RepID=UPI0028168D5B|nr:uncharacterized protein LOC132067074 [Lycium ferocissimum]
MNWSNPMLKSTFYARCMLKIDLQKAYDSVKWVFIQQMLEELGFSELYISWVMECIQTVNYSMLINGEPTQPFHAAKGLREGDPVSHFLFGVAVECLSRALVDLKIVKEYKYHPRCAKLGITHLSFVDDLLLFARGDGPSVLAMFQCFTKFSTVLGLKANMSKSSIYFGGVQQSIQDQILDQLQLSRDELPFKKILSSRVLTAQIQYDPASSKSLIRQAYLQLLGAYPRVEWKGLMFKDDARSRAKFVMWLYLHGGMRTTDKLIQWGLDVEPKYAPCQLHNENREHLFVLCEYTRGLWNRMLQWVDRPHISAGNWR